MCWLPHLHQPWADGAVLARNNKLAKKQGVDARLDYSHISYTACTHYYSQVTGKWFIYCGVLMLAVKTVLHKVKEISSLPMYSIGRG